MQQIMFPSNPAPLPTASFQELQTLKRQLTSRLKSAQKAGNAVEVDNIKPALDEVEGFMQVNIKGLRELDADYKFLVSKPGPADPDAYMGALPRARALLRTLRGTGGSHAKSRAAATEQMTAGGTIVSKSGLVDRTLGALFGRRGARAQAAQELLIPPTRTLPPRIAADASALNRSLAPAAQPSMTMRALLAGFSPTARNLLWLNNLDR
jgi:hypothetical protein